MATIDRKTLIQNAIIGSALAIFIFFFFLPLVMKNKKSIDETHMLEMMIRQAKTKIARIPEMKNQKKLYGARIDRVREQFFEAEEVDQLIQIISATAGETGVQITASRPASRELDLGAPFAQMYLAVSYELTIEGSYHHIGTFINRLERYPKNFAIHELRITSGEKMPVVPQCTLILTAFLKRVSITQLAMPMGMPPFQMPRK